MNRGEASLLLLGFLLSRSGLFFDRSIFLSGSGLFFGGSLLSGSSFFFGGSLVLGGSSFFLSRSLLSGSGFFFGGSFFLSGSGFFLDRSLFLSGDFLLLRLGGHLLDESVVGGDGGLGLQDGGAGGDKLVLRVLAVLGKYCLPSST